MKDCSINGFREGDVYTSVSLNKNELPHTGASFERLAR
jgi:hypothetical protein